MSNARAEALVKHSTKGSRHVLARRGVLALAWVAGWNVLGLIRFPAFIDDPFARQIGPWRSFGTLAFDQTSWALATLFAFTFALRARRHSMRSVIAGIAVLAVPVVTLRYWGAFSLVHALGWYPP